MNLQTYYAADDNGRWINHFDGNGLVDYTNLDYAEQQFANVTDPTRASRSSSAATNCWQPRPSGGRSSKS